MYIRSANPIVGLKILFSFSFFVLSINTWGQSSKIDSLKKILIVEENDSMKWRITLRLAVSYVPFSSDSSMAYCKKALTMAERIKSPYMLYYSYNEMGNCYSDIVQNAKAIEFYDKSYSVANANKSLDPNFPLGNIASLLMAQNKYHEASEKIKKIIADYHKKEGTDSVNLATQYLNLGSCQYFLNNTKDAEVSYTKSMAFNNKKEPFAYLETMNNLAATYRKNKQFDKAMALLKANAIDSEKLNSPNIEAQRLINMGLVSYDLNQLEESKKYFNQAFNLKGEISLDNQQDIFYRLSSIYEKQGNHLLALNYYKKYYTITDSINDKVYDDKIISFESQIDMAEKDKELASQKFTIIEGLAQKRKWQILLGSLLFLIATATIIYYYRQRLVQQKYKNTMIAQKLEMEKIKEVDELKTAFFTNISHEFRTPITLIKGPLNEMLKSGKVENKPFLKLMSKQVDRLYELINQLLDLTKVDTGSMPIHLSRINVSEFFNQLSYDFQNIAAKKEISFKIQVPNEDLEIESDAEKIKKIFTNLLSNAFKFTESGGLVNVMVYQKNGDLRIEVLDTGIGIPEEKREKIFDRFVSLNTDYEYEGTGIGLALTKELSKLLGGDISVESALEKGSRFIVTIPIKVLNSSNSSQAVQVINIEEELAFNELLKPKILVVEDNEDMQFFLYEILNKDWIVHQALNGKEGFNKANEILPDIILSDIMMPQDDGIAMLNKLKKNESTNHIPLVFLTAKGDQVDKIAGLKTGAVDYLTKPFDSNELTLKLGNILRIRSENHTINKQHLYTICPPVSTENSENDRFIAKLKLEIDANYEDELFSIEALGQKVGLSRSQLYRKVHALTGESPIEILKNYRLEKAKDLLEQKIANVSEIAFRTGFSSPSYFIKCFKDKYGITPSKMEQL